MPPASPVMLSINRIRFARSASERVEIWIAVAPQAGFVDRHEIAALVKRGCPPKLALEIAH